VAFFGKPDAVRRLWKSNGWIGSPGLKGPFFAGGDFGGLKPAAFSVVPLGGT